MGHLVVFEIVLNSVRCRAIQGIYMIQTLTAHVMKNFWFQEF